MAQSAQIQKMSTRHEAILNYILANPTLKYSEVAAFFQVTPAWLSTIVHSHAFQDQLQLRQDEVFESAVLGEISEKVMAAAHMTIDEYMEKVPNLSPDQLISSSDKLLGRLGFGARNGNGTTVLGDVNVVQQNLRVSKEILSEARDRIGSHKVGEGDSPAALPDKSADKGTQIEGTVIRADGAPEAVG